MMNTHLGFLLNLFSIKNIKSHLFNTFMVNFVEWRFTMKFGSAYKLDIVCTAKCFEALSTDVFVTFLTEIFCLLWWTNLFDNKWISESFPFLWLS